jgi:hypothetical protein
MAGLWCAKNTVCSLWCCQGLSGAISAAFRPRALLIATTFPCHVMLGLAYGAGPVFCSANSGSRQGRRLELLLPL